MSPRLDPGEQAVAVQIGENLGRCRRRAGLSAVELARRAHLSRTTIHIIERGERLPGLDTVVQLAGGLEVDPTELMRGVAWRPPRGKRPGAFYVRRRRVSLA